MSKENKEYRPKDPLIVSKTMSHIRGKDTSIELKLRRKLSELGYRYFKNSKKVYGHPDIVFIAYRIAIFLDSEFWHGYHFEEGKKAIKIHQDYWIPKIERNIVRDKQVNEELAKQGYKVLRYWGFEIEKDFDRVVDEIVSLVEKQKAIQKQIESIQVFTTLAYLEKDNQYLFLYRNKKKNDPNEGKYIGVGGHIENGESIQACLKREIKEETGYIVDSAHYQGYINFLNDACPCERMYLYLVPSFHGEEITCNEGNLLWVEKDKISSLNLWEGDKAFLPLLGKYPKAFHLNLVYHGDQLLEIQGPFFKI